MASGHLVHCRVYWKFSIVSDYMKTIEKNNRKEKLLFSLHYEPWYFSDIFKTIIHGKSVFIVRTMPCSTLLQWIGILMLCSLRLCSFLSCKYIVYTNCFLNLHWNIFLISLFRVDVELKLSLVVNYYWVC